LRWFHWYSRDQDALTQFLSSQNLAFEYSMSTSYNAHPGIIAHPI
jgi:hypothetical protein